MSASFESQKQIVARKLGWLPATSSASPVGSSPSGICRLSDEQLDLLEKIVQLEREEMDLAESGETSIPTSANYFPEDQISIDTVASVDETGLEPDTIPHTPGEPYLSSEASQPTGKLRFRVLRAHAEGGLGRVSVARDEQLHRDVAVKEIKEKFADRLESRSRFLFEAKVTGRLEHPGVVPVYALGSHADGRPYYAMRFITGESLLSGIRQLHAESREFDLRLRQYLSRFVSVCNTMEYAHRHDIIHRDLKPSNIMLGEYGETLVVDWGLAKLVKTKADTADGETSNGVPGDETVSEQSDLVKPGHLSEMGSIVGTPHYMPPEQAMGLSQKLGPHSDIYSLGATLMHLITGAAPFNEWSSGDVGTLLSKVRDGEFRHPRQVRSNVSKSLEAIVLHAMAREPDRRYASSREMAEDLERWLADEKVKVANETLWQRSSRWLKKHRSFALTAGVSLVLIAAVATIFSWFLNNSLNEKSRLLDVAELQLDFDTKLREVREQSEDANPDTEWDEMLVSEDQATSLSNILNDLDEISSDVKAIDVRRSRMLSVWSNSIEKLAGARMTDSTAERLKSEIERFGNSFPWKNEEHAEEVSRLEDLSEQRIYSWLTMDAELPSKDFLKVGDGFERLNAEDWRVTVGDCPKGNLRFEVTFGPEWQDTSYLGIWLNAEEGSGYELVVADETFDPRYGLAGSNAFKLGKSADLGRLCMFLVRDGEMLLRTPFSVTGDLRLRLTRENVSGLTITAGNDQQATFDDLFPILPSQQGTFGVICSPGQKIIGEPKFERQRAPAVRLEGHERKIEIADQLFANGDLAAAREAYSDKDLSEDQEAQVKLALTYKEESTEKYLATLEKVMSDLIPNKGIEGYERSKQWYLYAGAMLLEHYLGRGDQSHSRIANTLDYLKPLTTLEEIARLIPENVKQPFNEVLVKPGQRFRIAFYNEGDAEDLNRALKQVDLFSNNPSWRRLAAWRLADAERCRNTDDLTEPRQRAQNILESLVDEVVNDPSPNRIERTALISDLVWLLNLEGKYDQSLEQVNRFIQEDNFLDSSYEWPLLLDRARTYYHQVEGDPEQTDAAIADLKQFLDLTNPKMSQPGIHYAYFSEACGMLGLLYKDRGEEKEAMRVWQKGRRRNWHEGFPDPKVLGSARGWGMILESLVAEPFLCAWTLDGKDPGYYDVEWPIVIESLFAGSGLDDKVIYNMIFRTERIPDRWKKLVAENTFSGPKGEEMGRKHLFRLHGLKDCISGGLYMILYQGVLRITFDGQDTLDLFPDFSDELFGQVQSIVNHYNQGRLSESDMGFILEAFTGDFNKKTFRKLERQLEDPELTSGLALVFGTMMIKHYDKAERGSALIREYVIERPSQVPPVYLELARHTLGMPDSEENSDPAP